MENDERFAKLEAQVAELQKLVAELKAAPAQQGLGLKRTQNAMSGAQRAEFLMLQAAMVEAYARTMGTKYSYDGAKDTQALKRLLKSELTVTQLVERWVYAIRERRTASLHLFAMNLNLMVPSKARAVKQAVVEKGTDLYGE